MPRGVVTDRYAATLIFGDIIASGYLPPDVKNGTEEKYYLQVTAPGLTSHAVRMTEKAWEQYLESGAVDGTPCVMEVRSSVFNGAQYYSADSFHVRSPGAPVFVAKSEKAEKAADKK